MKFLGVYLTAVFFLVAGNANAVEMPEYLIGQWCRTTETPFDWLKNDGKYNTHSDGDFIKAKNFCKETRPVTFIIHQVGFWIKLADVKTKILCVPRKVNMWAHGWSVVADCGAEDLSTDVYRMGFNFESWRQGELYVSRSPPRED